MNQQQQSQLPLQFLPPQLASSKTQTNSPNARVNVSQGQNQKIANNQRRSQGVNSSQVVQKSVSNKANAVMRSQRSKHGSGLSHSPRMSSGRQREEEISPSAIMLSSHNSQNTNLTLFSGRQVMAPIFKSKNDSNSRRSNRYQRPQSGGHHHQSSADDKRIKDNQLFQIAPSSHLGNNRISNKQISHTDLLQNRREQSGGNPARSSNASFSGTPMNVIQNVYSTSNLLSKRLSGAANNVGKVFEDKQKQKRQNLKSAKLGGAAPNKRTKTREAFDEQQNVCRTIDQEEKSNYFSSRVQEGSSSCEKNPPKNYTFTGGSLRNQQYNQKHQQVRKTSKSPNKSKALHNNISCNSNNNCFIKTTNKKSNHQLNHQQNKLQQLQQKQQQFPLTNNINIRTSSSNQTATKMKKNKQQHYFTAGASGVSAPSVSCTTGPSGINISNIVVNNTAISANASAQNGNIAGPPQAGSGIIMSQSSSNTNAANTNAQSINASLTKGGSSSVSSAAKKRNTIAGVPQTANSGTNPADFLNKQHQPINIGNQIIPSKKVNNFMIDPTGYSSVHQHQAQLVKNSKQHQTACLSTKSSQGPNHHHQKTHSSGAATTKHSAMKNAKDQGGWKFVERRLSAKILHQHDGSSTSNSVGPVKKGTNNAGIGALSNGALGGSKGSIQYENLMLQQLLKQQHKLDIEKQGSASGLNTGGAFKKNLSVISIDQPNQVATNALAAAAQSIAAPQMMLNISYNMNNNIDANSAAQFVFNQHPPSNQVNGGNGSGIQNQGLTGQNDALGQVLAAAQQHQSLSNQYQQQIRTIIGLAAQGELPLNIGGSTSTQGGHQVPNLPNPSNVQGLVPDLNQQQHHHQNTAATSTTHPLMEASSQAQYKTQVDTKKQKQGVIGGNPYHTNASSSILGEGMMTYENSIVQAVKNAELKYREQSFDQIKRKRRSVNPSAAGTSGTGAGRSNKQQLSNNSGRRIGVSHKVISQQPSQHPNSRSTSSKRKGDGKGSQQNNQSNFRGESSRGLLSSGHQAPSQSNSASAQQYHQSKKNVQKKSIEQAKLKVKGSFSQPPELQNHRTVSNHQAAATAPSNQSILYPHPHPSSHVLTPISQSAANTDKDRYLLFKLDEALESDLKEKASNQRVSICSKVWSEIIRRQDPVIASLLSKIKMNYEYHIKHQTKQLSLNGQNLKEATSKSEVSQLEKDLAAEREARKCAEEKAEGLTTEVQRLVAQVKKQEDIMTEMKKQILGYRREIIDLSSHKKAYSMGGQSNNYHHNSKSEGRKVPRLDLSKLHRDSENVDENEDGESCVSIQDPLMEDENGKNVTYQQYLKFLENENRLPDSSNAGQIPTNFQQFYNQAQMLPPPDQLAEESQESLIRQEELKQRKNKIIQLLNGDISDGERGGEEDEDQEDDAQEESMQDEEYVDDDQNYEDEGEYTEEMFQQRLNVGQFTAELKKASQDFNDFHQIREQKGGAHLVTEEGSIYNQQVSNQPDEESQQIDLVSAANIAAKARAGINLKYHMIDKKQSLPTESISAPKGAHKNFKFEVFDNQVKNNQNQYSELIQDILDNEENEAYQEEEEIDGDKFDAQRFLEEMEQNEGDQFMELDPETEQIISKVNGKNQQLTRSNSCS